MSDNRGNSRENGRRSSQGSRKGPGNGRRSGKKKRQAGYRLANVNRGLVILIIIAVILGIYSCAVRGDREIVNVDASEPNIDVQLLDVNPYSRPGTQVNQINGIVVHYTANPGSTAQQNRDYFNGLKDSHETEASSNFIVGLDGEIIQCVPTWEMAYASNERNADTVSIECCHPDESGRFTDDTYRSLVQLTAWLCVKFNLTQDDVIRHYDVTGKDCPKYFVENPEEWEIFKENVGRAIEKSSAE